MRHWWKQIIMEKIYIRQANESDAKNILDFTNLYFHDCEPLELSHPESGHESKNIELIFEAIKSESMLVAVEGTTKTLVGILIACPIGADEAENLELSAASIGVQKRADIINFLAYIEKKANYCERFGVEESLHMHIVSVHPIYRGQQIARKLFESCLSIAKSKNFKLISVDCTSSYSARIAESLGMECISTVTYQEYNNYLGKCLFIPNLPHNEIKSFARRL
jgi:ribosomal protein S18 acetylase RimI-like enzyme